jgi:fucose 4-O-acetylase-like acetyltransferase
VLLQNISVSLQRKFMNANNERIAWVDVFKFLAIWAIYIGHFGSKAGRLYPFVFAYHVPMFFFAAGFFSTRSLRDAPLPFVKKKTLQLMVPYVFFSVLALIVFTLLNDWDILHAKNATISALLGIRNQVFAGSLWFIPCLYLMAIGDYFIRKLFKLQALVLAVAVGLFIITQTVLLHNPALKPSWFMNADSALYYYVYYVLGAILFPLIAKEPTEGIHKAATIALTIVSGMVVAITFFLGSSWFLGKIARLIPTVSTFQLAIAFFNVIIALTIIYFNVVIAKSFAHVLVLGELGRETLVFCGTEDVTKNVLTQLLAMFDLKLRLISPLTTVIFSLMCLLVSNYTAVRFLNTYFPWTVGKIKLIPSQGQ